MNIYPIRCDGDDVLKYIYPLKQKAAQKAIELARADSRIKRVIVFGSALTMKCGMLSDIDIALDVPDISEDDFAHLARPFFIQIPSEVDVVHYNTIKSELLKQNVEKGVCIYVKQ